MLINVMDLVLVVTEKEGNYSAAPHLHTISLNNIGVL